MVGSTSAVVLQACKERLHDSRSTNYHADNTNYGNLSNHAKAGNHANHTN